MNPASREGIGVDEILLIPTVNMETELGKEVRSREFEYFYHITGSKEDYTYLARRYNIPENFIRAANTGISEPFLQGQYIKIPVDEAFSVLQEMVDEGDPQVSFDPSLPVIKDFRHEVKAGETLYSIARQYNITVQQIRSVNPGLGSTLEIGDRLRIPDVQQNTPQPTVEKVEETKEEEKQPAFYNHRGKKLKKPKKRKNNRHSTITG
jgi:LysM repeat protein